jgi:class 3 adenylate cyclase
MTAAGPETLPSRPPEGGEGPLETAVLFMDLVASSEFASVLGLEEYARYVDSFEQLCREQCAYFFEEVHKGKGWTVGRDYEFQFVGDELVVFMHTTNARQNIYQLLTLAVTIKCGWLGTPLNARRLKLGAPSAELAAGIHIGNVWAQDTGVGYKKRGFSINVGKRIESASRDGQNFRVYVSDPAMKRLNRLIRNILFSPRKILAMKGVVVPVGVYEVLDSFLDPASRMKPELFRGFREQAHRAIATNSFDLWIHSCLQVSEQAREKKVTPENLEFCYRTLNIDPTNACALYHAAQAARDEGNLEMARIFYRDLTAHWPAFGDGWLELGRVLQRMGDKHEARHAVLQAYRCGIPQSEQELPSLT